MKGLTAFIRLFFLDKQNKNKKKMQEAEIGIWYILLRAVPTQVNRHSSELIITGFQNDQNRFEFLLQMHWKKLFFFLSTSSKLIENVVYYY